MANQTYLLPFIDYERAFRVMYSVLTSVGAITTRSCLFFSIAGALILQRFYNKRAFPIAGSFSYFVDQPDLHSGAPILVSYTNNRSSRDKFHCWIECEGWVIDFMSPLFREALAIAGSDIAIPRRMFQKPHSTICASQAE